MLTYTVATPNTQTKSNRLGTMIRLTYELTWRHIQTRPNAGAYRYTGDGQHSLGNNDRRMIGGCFNLWGRTERLLQVNTKSIPKDKTPTNQTKSNENKTDRHRQT